MPDRPSPSARPLRCALALAATLLAVAGCGGSDSDDSGGGGGGGGPTPSRPAKVDVGTLPISNAAPMYLGMRKGFFEEEGLELVPHVAQNGAELITGALSGSFDFIFAGYIPSIVARAKGLPITVVAASDLGAKEDSKEWTVTLSKRGSDIRTPKDLEGRTIAVNGLRGVGEVVIKASLEKQGVDPNSIKLLEVPFPEMPVALERGRSTRSGRPSRSSPRSSARARVRWTRRSSHSRRTSSTAATRRATSTSPRTATSSSASTAR
jgi:NitT/TauT family transport system substrate-binding protein